MVSCEKVLTSDRKAEEEAFLERRERYIRGEIGLEASVNAAHDKLTKQHDPVNHPPHYTNSSAKCKCGRAIECIDVTRHLNFNIGNAIKYLWRCDLKGNSMEDLKKAIWYIEDEINERLKNG